VRGRIGELADGTLHFVGNFMSLSLRFEDLVFNYDEIPSVEKRSDEAFTRVAQLTMRVRAQHEIVSDPLLCPNTTLKIVEDIAMRSGNGVPYLPIHS
jgi:hypothetical protein